MDDLCPDNHAMSYFNIFTQLVLCELLGFQLFIVFNCRKLDDDHQNDETASRPNYELWRTGTSLEQMNQLQPRSPKECVPHY
jgi:hypothetical protein